MISSLFPPTSPAEIDAFQAETGLSLPDDYRTFLLRSNGGRPSPSAFATAKPGIEASVGIMYGLGASSACDLRFWFRELEDRVGEGFLPIGRDPGGNSLLLATVGVERGAVYYWDSAYFFPESNDEEGNTYFVAASFTKFLAGLTPVEEDEDE